MSRRVLIVDPNDAIRARIRSLIEKGGWEVLGEAADGQECIDKVNLFAPDLVILDLNMPVKNAIQAAAEIRKTQPATKLLVFTIHDSPVIRDEVLRAGIDGFAAKSSADQLLAEIARLLDPHGAS